LAVDEQGHPLGQVAEMWETGPVPNLVIRKEGAEDLVVPFAEDFVREVDVPNGRLVIRPPEYLE
jgi:16S rRNA processing protein RimM